MTPAGRDRSPWTPQTPVASRLEALRVMKRIATTKALWMEITEEREMEGHTERGYEVEGVWYPVSYSAVRTWHADRDPPFHYLVRFAQVLDVNPELLLTGSEGWLDRTREEVERAAVRRSDETERSKTLAYLLNLDCGDQRRAPDRRAAVQRFASKLDDARGPDVAWIDRIVYREVLADAMRFLVQLDETASEIGRLEPQADKTTAAGRLSSPWFLRESASDSWYVTWSDAVLDLFARRVIGLGERAGGLTDSHAPAAARSSRRS